MIIAVIFLRGIFLSTMWLTEQTLNWLQFLAIKMVIRIIHVPKHVAFIMDGNRRYAKKKQTQRSTEKVDGHRKGFDKLSETLNWCMDLGIEEITVYAFSIENFKRSKEEVDGLMELATQQFQSLINEKDKLKEIGVCVRVIGNMSLLPENLRKLIATVMTITKNNNKIVLNVAFCYTSRDEITHAIKDIAKGVKRNDILPEDINEDLISDCLYTYNSSNPDLLIRTAGEVRFSDFLMWQISETCVYFTNVLWPEFSIWHFFGAIIYYHKCYYDIQKNIKIRNPKQIVHNNRVSMYIDKLHHDRQVTIESMCLPPMQS